MYRRCRYCLFLIHKESYWFVSCFCNLAFIIVEVEIMSLSQGFHLNALYIINHIQSLGPKLFAFLFDHLLFCNGFGFCYPMYILCT